MYVCTIINDTVSRFFKYKIIILGKNILFKNFLFCTYLLNIYSYVFNACTSIVNS